MTDEQPNQPKKTRYLVPIILLGVAVLVLAESVRVYRQPEGPQAAFKWHKDLESAQAEAREKGQPILLYFTAAYCMPCKEMASSVFPNKRLGQVMQDWQAVKVDMQDGARLARKYKVFAVPDFIVLDRTGKFVTRQAGFMSVNTLIDWLGDAAELAKRQGG